MGGCLLFLFLALAWLSSLGLQWHAAVYVALLCPLYWASCLLSLIADSRPCDCCFEKLVFSSVCAEQW